MVIWEYFKEENWFDFILKGNFKIGFEYVYLFDLKYVFDRYR